MTTYYFAASGNDSAPTNSQATPWKTIAKANTLSLNPGDSLVFNGGDTFSDATLKITNSGSAGNPITVTSYGNGNAVIVQLNSSGAYQAAVWLSDVSYVTVQNINVGGPGVTGGSRASGGGATSSVDAGIKATLTSSSDLSGIVIKNNTISGCFYGILLKIAAASSNSFQSPTITGNTIIGCGFCGIALWQLPLFVPGQSGSGISHSLQIVSPSVSGNSVSSVYGVTAAALTAQGDYPSSMWSGFGMWLQNCSAGLVSGNLVHDCGIASQNSQPGGPVGIMTIQSNGTVIRSNEVYNQYGPDGSDGEGIDTDGGSRNCIVERNYIHNCAGPAMMDFQIGGCDLNNNNTFRWNITQNNGRTSPGWNACGHNSQGNGGCYVYQNTFYEDAAGSVNNQILLGSVFTNYFNNILSARNGMKFGYIGVSNFNLAGNLYDAQGGSTFSLQVNNSSPYTSLALLQAAGFEIVKGLPVGSTTNPALSAPGAGGSYGPGLAQGTLTAYDPPAVSFVRRGDINLLAYFGLDAGGVDFHGNPYT